VRIFSEIRIAQDFIAEVPDIARDCVVKFNYQFRKFARPSTGQLIGFMANGEPEGFRQGLALFRYVLLFYSEYEKIILLNIFKTNLLKAKKFYIVRKWFDSIFS